MTDTRGTSPTTMCAAGGTPATPPQAVQATAAIIRHQAVARIRMAPLAIPFLTMRCVFTSVLSQATRGHPGSVCGARTRRSLLGPWVAQPTHSGPAVEPVRLAHRSAIVDGHPLGLQYLHQSAALDTANGMFSGRQGGVRVGPAGSDEEVDSEEQLLVGEPVGGVAGVVMGLHPAKLVSGRSGAQQSVRRHGTPIRRPPDVRSFAAAVRMRTSAVWASTGTGQRASTRLGRLP